jgi:AcrR family transcriptional regulator
VGTDRVSALGPDSAPTRRERNGEATRKRLLDAAEREFAIKGFDGARLASIARAADAPQALIHHYFDDKAGLHRSVVARALGAITAEGWRILDSLAPRRRRSRSEHFETDQLHALVEALVGLLVDFSAAHAQVLRILQNDAERGGSLGDELLRTLVKPQLEDVVARLEEMRARGEVRRDVDPRDLCLSTVAMACFPALEEAFVSTVWSVRPAGSEFNERRKREIIVTIMARVAPC